MANRNNIQIVNLKQRNENLKHTNCSKKWQYNGSVTMLLISIKSNTRDPREGWHWKLHSIISKLNSRVEIILILVSYQQETHWQCTAQSCCEVPKIAIAIAIYSAVTKSWCTVQVSFSQCSVQSSSFIGRALDIQSPWSIHQTFSDITKTCFVSPVPCPSVAPQVLDKVICSPQLPLADTTYIQIHQAMHELQTKQQIHQPTSSKQIDW